VSTAENDKDFLVISAIDCLTSYFLYLQPCTPEEPANCPLEKQAQVAQSLLHVFQQVRVVITTDNIDPQMLLVQINKNLSMKLQCWLLFVRHFGELLQKQVMLETKGFITAV